MKKLILITAILISVFNAKSQNLYDFEDVPSIIFNTHKQPAKFLASKCIDVNCGGMEKEVSFVEFTKDSIYFGNRKFKIIQLNHFEKVDESHSRITYFVKDNESPINMVCIFLYNEIRGVQFFAGVVDEKLKQYDFSYYAIQSSQNLKIK